MADAAEIESRGGTRSWKCGDPVKRFRYCIDEIGQHRLDQRARCLMFDDSFRLHYVKATVTSGHRGASGCSFQLTSD